MRSPSERTSDAEYSDGGFGSFIARIIISTIKADFQIAVHPGDVLQEMLAEAGVTQVRLAKHLNTDVARINEICRRRRDISASMAVLLAKAFGTSALLWMNLQASWELSQIDPGTAKRVRPLLQSA